MPFMCRSATCSSPSRPQEPVPIPDFRSLAGRAVQATEPEPPGYDLYLPGTAELVSRLRRGSRSSRNVGFIGRATVDTPPEDGRGPDARRRLASIWPPAARVRHGRKRLRLFIRQADAASVLVMVSGVVMSNTRRRLDPVEFRGFALCDPLAPLIFVNGADTKAAQMFTLAHELAHLWLGASALSNSEAAPRPEARREEVWCNAVAAELLVPLAALRAELRKAEALPQALARLARAFKVSTLVILRRLLDADWLDRGRFDAAWAQESARLHTLAQRGSDGGDFYRTTLSRVSRRFAHALVVSTLEGQTLYRDAYRMLGVSKAETFNRLGREVGVMG